MSTLPFLPANLTHLVFVVDHAPGHSFQPEPPKMRQSSRRRSSISTKSDEMDSSNFSVSSASPAISSMESWLGISSSDTSIQQAMVQHRGGWIRDSMKSAPKKPRRRNTPPASPEAPMEDHQKPQRRGSMECHQKPQRRGSLVRAVSHISTVASIHKSGLTF
ncbi:hypothetical protein SEMRO_622_G177040.1 [Seminavis robusta]|uniref:Uncharacterized protein n=1 Tax=Seminavis robusta TaxID=568900 RepID=A0A9N8HIX7_9STRA|nr:hypothetical protein SEMRO_622_G177040.1 [Seminavis robusta]|eukprot:Sro622_g177040.1 n/a (162) ;mRNA; f:45714-46199